MLYSDITSRAHRLTAGLPLVHDVIWNADRGANCWWVVFSGATIVVGGLCVVFARLSMSGVGTQSRMNFGAHLGVLFEDSFSSNTPCFRDNGAGTCNNVHVFFMFIYLKVSGQVPTFAFDHSGQDLQAPTESVIRCQKCGEIFSNAQQVCPGPLSEGGCRYPGKCCDFIRLQVNR